MADGTKKLICASVLTLTFGLTLTAYLYKSNYLNHSIFGKQKRKERPQIIVEASFTAEVTHSNTTSDVLSGYDWFNGNKSFIRHCNSCGLVSSSGTILGTGAGKEIDEHECVIRMNNAPTEKYEEDVGTRTTFRVFSHTSVTPVINLLAKPQDTEADSTIFFIWGPKTKIQPGGSTHEWLVYLAKKHPKINLYTFKWSTILNADDIFERETGRNRVKSGSYLSTGWFTMLFIKKLCADIHVYGMIEDDYCDKMKKQGLRDVPYHYYEKVAGQCATYKWHENAKAGVHRFITEKRVFKKWAALWGNVHFHHPEWALA